MDRLPQGLPRDWRRTVRNLKRDPRRGGPPASNVGYGPDSSPLHPLGLPLPNFRGLHRDGMPCHVDFETILQFYRNRHEAPVFNGPPRGIRLSIMDYCHLKSAQSRHLFASCQPLTVQPLPDGSNIYNAEVGIIEQDFQDAFTWYKRWLEFLHYETLHRGQFQRLSTLAATVERWSFEQTLFPPAEASPENGLYPVPPPLQEWVWPWYFWNAWQIRRDLRAWPDQWQRRDFSIEILNTCSQKEEAIERALFSTDWYEDRQTLLPRALRELEDGEMARTIFNDLQILLDAQREFFQTHALRYWSFKRPWKKLWLIMDSDNSPQSVGNKVRECQRFLHADAFGSLLLGVHLLLLSQVREKTEGCVITGSESCTGDWAEGNLVAQTWCDHITCFPCLWHYWQGHQFDIDAGNIPNPVVAGDWPCVLCRTSPGRLRSKLEIAQTELVGEDGDHAADQNILDLTHEPIPHYR